MGGSGRSVPAMPDSALVALVPGWSASPGPQCRPLSGLGAGETLTKARRPGHFPPNTPTPLAQNKNWPTQPHLGGPAKSCQVHPGGGAQCQQRMHRKGWGAWPTGTQPGASGMATGRWRCPSPSPKETPSQEGPTSPSMLGAGKGVSFGSWLPCHPHRAPCAHQASRARALPQGAGAGVQRLETLPSPR